MLLYDQHNDTTEEVRKETIVVKTRLETLRDALIEHFLGRGVKLIAAPVCTRKQYIYEPKYAYKVKQPHHVPILIGTTVSKQEKGLPTYSGKSFTTNVEWPVMRSQAVKKVR